jgi:outer membrane protein
MKNILILFLALVSAQALYAQQSSHVRASSYVLTYSIGFPMSNMKDYTSKTSFRGASMEFNKGVKPNLDAGLEVGWNVFYEKVAEKTYTNETASITGVQYRYVNTVPIIAGVKYYKSTNDDNLKPFIGVGVGTLYTEHSTEFGLYVIRNDAWQFCIRPELGVEFRAKGGFAFTLGGKYYAGFKGGNLDAQSFITINAGFVFSSGF